MQLFFCQNPFVLTVVPYMPVEAEKHTEVVPLLLFLLLLLLEATRESSLECTTSRVANKVWQPSTNYGRWMAHSAIIIPRLDRQTDGNTTPYEKGKEIEEGERKEEGRFYCFSATSGSPGQNLPVVATEW